MLVDDHNLVRRGLAALLHNDGRYEVVAEASNGQEALSQLDTAAAEVMMLDLAMPRLNGECLNRTCESSLCRSGEVLQGAIKPHQCEAFGKECTPRTPLGATMVSSEGACAAYYNYGRFVQPNSTAVP